jgi:hypothetical protein
MKETADGSQPSLDEIAINFSALKDPSTFNKLMDYLNVLMIHCRNRNDGANNMDDNKLLEEVGKIVFCLSRLYDIQRGNGAVTQWMARAIIRDCTQDRVDIGDIRMGGLFEKSLNIPCDVYAQLTDDMNSYAQAFANAVIDEYKFKNIYSFAGIFNAANLQEVLVSEKPETVKLMIAYLGEEKLLALLSDANLNQVNIARQDKAWNSLLDNLPKSVLKFLTDNQNNQDYTVVHQLLAEHKPQSNLVKYSLLSHQPSHQAPDEGLAPKGPSNR